MDVIEMEIPEGAIAEREAQRRATTKDEHTLIWVVYCLSCGKELDKAPNGAFMEAVARRHKKENPAHAVILGTYQEVK